MHLRAQVPSARVRPIALARMAILGMFHKRTESKASSGLTQHSVKLDILAALRPRPTARR